jgi:phosphoglycolate phosphatase
MKKYDLLIFDWDGTIVNSIGLIIECVQTAAYELELKAVSDEAVRDCIGLVLDDLVFRLFPKADPSAFAKIFYRDYTEEKLQTHFFQGAIDTLQKLKDQGYTLAIATNKIRSQLKHALKTAKIDTLFSTLRCGDDGQTKPHPEMILTILEELDIKPKKAVMIGDSIYDLLMAQNAKVDSIAVTYGSHKKQELLTHKPIFCIDDIKELAEMLLP